ncbi:MAG: RNA-binding transcriptional accessory protein, partial [Chloroflexi bacterium]|nr:RNA-binding transcriptional accessory protein [Chloroflexota bacterium]
MAEPPGRHLARLAAELRLSVEQVRATATLLADGATVPFVARYRKEATGSLDEVAITSIRDRLAQLDALDRRRDAILTSLEERRLLTPELRAQLDHAETTATLEDLYQPFRPRRRTRASDARERGLEPLADLLLRQQRHVDPHREAARFVRPLDRPVEDGLRVESVAAALHGARDIIAERVSDDAEARARIRRLFWSGALLTSHVRSGKEAAGAKYAHYFDWSEPVRSAPSHRVLAMFRGEAEEVLRIAIEPSASDALRLLEQLFLRGTGACTDQVRMAVDDGYRRLLVRSMETETRGELKQCADAAAIRVFAQNLQQLLLAAPLGQKRVLAIDPGLRTGCKVVVLDAQ